MVVWYLETHFFSKKLETYQIIFLNFVSLEEFSAAEHVKLIPDNVIITKSRSVTPFTVQKYL